MRRTLAYYLSREMAILGVIEFALTFAVIHAMLQATDATILWSDAIAIMPRDGIALPAFLAFGLGIIGLTIGLYRPEAYLNGRRLLAVSGFAILAALAVLLLLVSGVARHAFTLPHAIYLAKALGVWVLLMTVIRLACGYAIRTAPFARRIALVGHPDRLAAFAARLQSPRGQGFQLVIVPPQELSWQFLRRQRIGSVIVSQRADETVAEPLLDCKLRGVQVLSDAAFHEQHLGRIDLDSLTIHDLLLGEGFSRGSVAEFATRLSDIIIGVALLVMALPVMTLAAIAIKMDSAGPVFYRQQRVGQFDKPFTLFKFRSMSADAEAGGSPLWAQRQDPRVTRVGRFIRATRIDELPQLANVLRGEMSLVGPRPERPHFVEQLARAIPFYRQRGYVKPGLTGWAQVNFPYGASVEDAREKLAYDLYYVKHRTLLLDLLILLSTVRVVLFREGAR